MLRSRIGVPCRALMFAFATELQTDVRLRLRPGNSNRNFCPDSVLAEERIDRLQKNRLPASRHLRKLCIQHGFSMKIELSSIQPIVAGHVDMRSRDKKMKQRKGQQSIL